MKRILFICTLLALLLTTSAALAYDLPVSHAGSLAVPDAPTAPQVIHSQQLGDGLLITFDRTLPQERLLEFLALDADLRVAAVPYDYDDARNMAITTVLPAGAEWLRIELAWVSGGENATARYNIGGGLVQSSCFDAAFNEYVYDSTGVFMEFRDVASGIWTRFDQDGNAVRYSYEKDGMRVWFDLAGNVCWATLEYDGFSCTWEPGEGWFIEAPAGRIAVQVNLDPRDAAPLVIVAEPSPTPEVIWYPNNTIALAGLSLQEASTRLPDKWYNVVPIDLTRQGRQTYFLTISNARFIGECYVDVWGDEVTVSCEILDKSGIDLKSEYGRWFTSLSQVTTSSIESDRDGFVFGQPVSISRDLGGVDTALLFIRSKATYRQPFRDGTELPRYWRNTPDWKTFRRNLQELMPYVAN